MPEIYIIKDGRTIDQRTLTPAGLTIGRAVDVDLQLESGLVSRQHARISQEANGFVLADLNSGNGVFVNGTREYHRVLMPDDRVEIGGFILLYSPSSADKLPPRGSAPPPAPSAPPPPDDTEEQLGSGATMNIDSAELARLMRDKREQLEARFVILMDRGEKTYTLKKDKYTVGFHRDCDLRLPGTDGKKLFTVTKEGSEVIIKAIGFFAKVEVNGQRKKKFSLSHGDEINARGTILSYKAMGRQ